ncbi:MAG: hypothetical protein M3408_04800 [Actinomycetota bacterium]|nr:hypothetical protein [Actinomycetota bacterium]
MSGQVAALPAEVLAGYAEVLKVLQSTPWNGRPQHPANPDAPVRRWAFGPGQAGQVVYLILEEQQGGTPAARAMVGLTGPAPLRDVAPTTAP